MGWRNHLAVGDPLLRTNPAFGSQYKIMRNRAITSGVMKMNYGVDKIGSGVKVQETLSDPLHRDPRSIIYAARVEASIAGRARGHIRPAAPGQVTWKNSYWLQQRTRATRPTAIGPYIQGSLQKQSILYRISDTLSNLGRGGQ